MSDPFAIVLLRKLSFVFVSSAFHCIGEVEFKHIHLFDVCAANDVCAFKRPSGNLAYFPNKSLTVQNHTSVVFVLGNYHGETVVFTMLQADDKKQLILWLYKELYKFWIAKTLDDPLENTDFPVLVIKGNLMWILFCYMIRVQPHHPFHLLSLSNTANCWVSVSSLASTT